MELLTFFGNALHIGEKQQIDAEQSRHKARRERDKRSCQRVRAVRFSTVARCHFDTQSDDEHAEQHFDDPRRAELKKQRAGNDAEHDADRDRFLSQLCKFFFDLLKLPGNLFERLRINVAGDVRKPRHLIDIHSDALQLPPHVMLNILVNHLELSIFDQQTEILRHCQVASVDFSL